MSSISTRAQHGATKDSPSRRPSSPEGADRGISPASRRRSDLPRRLFPLVSLFLCALLVPLSALPQRAFADGLWNVGFTAIHLSRPEEGRAPAINVWYPTDSRRRRTVSLRSWSFQAANGADVAAGLFPVVLLSHPSAGTRFTHHDTASALAEHGFIVAAPEHAGDNLDNMPGYGTWKSLAERRDDLVRTLDIILSEERFASSVRPGAVGVLGFGTGGTAALLLGGALPDCGLWRGYCRRDRNVRDPYCNDWARERITREMCPSLPLRPSLADTRFRSVATVSPAYTMLFSSRALEYFHPPLLLVWGDSERTGEPASEREAMARRFPHAPETLVLAGADGGAFMAPCPEALAEELPELCYSVSPQERAAIHERLVEGLAAFFTRTLVTNGPGYIPDPPVFEVSGPPEPPRKDR